MPITAELQNVKKFESVGFTHEQAEVLAEVQEATARDSVGELKEFIRSEINALDNKFTSQINALDNKLISQIKASELRLETKIAEATNDLLKANNDMLVKIFGIVFASVTIAVAILKL